MSAFAWTNENLTKAATMWNEGQSGTDIAAAIGTTRNAVISKAHRTPKVFKAKHGVGKGYRRGKGSSIPTLDPQARRQRAKEFERSEAQRKAILEAVSGALEYDTGRLPLAKALIDLEPKECRWPLNEGGPFLFCSEEAAHGPYCSHHRLRRLPVRSSIEQLAE